MKKAILFCLIISFLAIPFGGCAVRNQQAEDPGNVYPPMVKYDGSLYFHRGGTIYELPEDAELIGKVNKSGQQSPLEKDMDGFEAGYLYKSGTDDNTLIFEYEIWDAEGEAPYLLMIREE